MSQKITSKRGRSRISLLHMKSLTLYSKFFEHMMGEEQLVRFIINEDINKQWNTTKLRRRRK